MNSISIITINYNNTQGLQQTIDSVLTQTFSDFEFLVIDGNSNDGSKEIIDKYKNNITYSISESDTGVYNAMNKGIKNATGDYLLFLNSGDTLYNKDSLEEISHYLNGSTEIIYGDAAYQEKTGEMIRTYPDKLSFNYFLNHNLSHQASFIKRTLFDKLFYYNENYKIVSDWEFFIYAICKMNVSYAHVNQIICNYDTEGISSLIDNHKLMHVEREETINKYFPLFKEDYQIISELNAKRTKQFFELKKNKTLYKIMKGFMSFLSLFLKKGNQSF